MKKLTLQTKHLLIWMLFSSNLSYIFKDLISKDFYFSKALFSISFKWIFFSSLHFFAKIQTTIISFLFPECLWTILCMLSQMGKRNKIKCWKCIFQSNQSWSSNGIHQQSTHYTLHTILVVKLKKKHSSHYKNWFYFGSCRTLLILFIYKIQYTTI